jgi:hypothetical protein
MCLVLRITVININISAEFFPWFDAPPKVEK